MDLVIADSGRPLDKKTPPAGLVGDSALSGHDQGGVTAGAAHAPDSGAAQAGTPPAARSSAAAKGIQPLNSSRPLAPTEPPRLRITLGADATGVFDAGLPVLVGETVEDLFGAARPAGRVRALALFEVRDWLLGAATVPLTAGLENAAYELYRNIFAAAPGWHLARIWNYVPAINAPGPAGLENYQVFCRGRSLAFEHHHGRGFQVLLPAASAVGRTPGALTVVFAACPVAPRHFENPLQVPAYDYPGDYGPRAPSFARATVVAGLERATVFISGTAAIRGHVTIAPDSTRDQLECTLENLHGIAAACGLGPGLGAGPGVTRHFKVYVRHAADQPMVAALLQKRLLADSDRVSYLQADICRASLHVEIEATLFGAKTSL